MKLQMWQLALHFQYGTPSLEVALNLFNFFSFPRLMHFSPCKFTCRGRLCFCPSRVVLTDSLTAWFMHLIYSQLVIFVLLCTVYSECRESTIRRDL